MKPWLSCRGTLLGLCLLGGGHVHGGEAMRYVFHPPESPLDKRYLYQWQILETALERTKDTCGAYVLEPSVFMTEKRQTFELRNATGKLTVMYRDTTPDLERNLIAVHVPVDKGLVGYRVCLIRNGDRARFAAVDTVDDLRAFKFGVGADWIDVGILHRISRQSPPGAHLGTGNWPYRRRQRGFSEHLRPHAPK